MAGGLSIDGAYVLAGAAADAAEDFLAVGGEHVGAAVVHEDDVHVLGAVGLVGRARAIDEFGVDGELLAGGGAAQQIEENREVLFLGNDLLDADQRDVDGHGSHPEARVALVGGEDETAAVRADEVGAGDAGLGLHVFFPQVDAGAAGNLAGVVVVFAADAFAEEGLRDIPAVEVDDGLDDVRGLVAVELDDEFAEVGLEALDAVFDEEGVKVDFLGCHRFGLGEPGDAVAAEDREDGLPGIFIGGGVVDVHAAGG